MLRGEDGEYDGGRLREREKKNDVGMLGKEDGEWGKGREKG